jgi:hypothetical protein
MYRPKTATNNLNSFGGGLIIESVTAKDIIFGYRLKLTYEVPPVPGIETHGFLKPLNRVGMFNTLTIGVVRTDSIRFWVGPEVGLSYAFHKNTRTYYTIMPYGGSFYPYKVSQTQIISALTVDLVIALGLNAHITDVTSCFIEVGLGYIGVFDLLSSKGGHGFDFQFCTGFIFRVNDTFVGSGQKENKDGVVVPGEE